MQLPLINDKAWDWCLLELRDKATYFEKNNTVLAFDTESPVCKSDTLIDDDLRRELISATEPLRNVLEAQRDWHPNSNDQVLNLVHPSLFPLVYGKTSVLMRGGKVPLDNVLSSYKDAEVAPVIMIPHRTPAERWQGGGTWSSRFTWLPCEVEFDGPRSRDVRITSYINNLHPRHKDVYSTIEKVIGLAIEPWNDILVKGWGRAPARIRTFGTEFVPSGPPEWAAGLRAIDDSKETDPEAYEKALIKVREYMDLPNREDWDEDLYGYEEPLASDDFREAFGLEGIVDAKWEQIKNVIHPDVGVSYTYEQWKKGQVSNPVFGRESYQFTHHYYDVDLRRDYEHKGLQVIVKLSGIELTPEKPTYEGGNWHIEGMQNEHIVATAIYYYDVENVTESRISFRTEAEMDDDDLEYTQGEHWPLAKIFGIESGWLSNEPAIQILGSVSTPQGRLIAFPNTLQHKVAPFELADKTKPGHRRFLVLWLVDPHYRICSTRNVPPQQHDWWAPGAYEKVDFTPFPAEILNMITDNIGEWPMGLDEAKKLRLELMAERTRAQEMVTERPGEYNFCEH